MAFSLHELASAAVAVAVTLLARLLTVGLPVRLLPPGPERNTVVALTYGVVMFSIPPQGLSIGYVTRKAVPHR